MKKIINRLGNALKFGSLALLKPEVFNANTLEMLVKLLELILKVQHDNKHYMAKIGIIHPEKKDHAIATIWVGAGADCSPEKRITELLKENAELKEMLMKGGQRR